MIDRAATYGQHSLIVEATAAISDDPLNTTWVCRHCLNSVLERELQDGSWADRMGATCPTFALLLTDTTEWETPDVRYHDDQLEREAERGGDAT